MSRDDTAQTVARALLDSDAFLLRPARPFRLTSGLLAPFYINCRRLLSHAEARSRVAEAQAAAIRGACRVCSSRRGSSRRLASCRLQAGCRARTRWCAVVPTAWSC